MFCNHCGGAIQAGQNFCPGCGRPVPPGPSAAAPAPGPAPAVRGRVARHLSALGLFWIVLSASRLLGSGGVFVFGRFIRHTPFPDPFAAHFVPRIFPAIGIFLFLSAALGFLCAIGLLQKYSWARMLALVLGGLNLLYPPFGTALGIYTLWVLLPAQSEQEFGALARA